ncbi:MAG: hypothetical protein H6Q33_2962 [Deltaproteobacteria bacterium]|nr:hypothetical protein [Deltaproteobacteria bacterium]
MTEMSLRGIKTGLWLLIFLLPLALRTAPSPPRQHPLSRETEALGLVIVLMIAIALRVVNLLTEPLFFLQDETLFAYTQDWRPEHGELFGYSLIQHWPWGWWPEVFGFGPGSLPNFLFLIHWLPLKVEFSFRALRMGTAITGVAAVLMVWIWVRRWWDNQMALLAALFLAIQLEHVYWSRVALPNIDAPLHGAAVLWALAWALETQSQRAWAVLGTLLGLTFYLYMGTKLNLVAAGVVLAGLWLTRLATVPLRRVALMACFCGLVMAPALWAIHQDSQRWYLDHAGRLDWRILNALAQGNGTEVLRLGREAWETSVGYFLDQPQLVNLIWVGIAMALWRIRDRRYFTVLIWLAVTFGVASIAIGWRNARLINIQPAFAVLAALGVDQLLRWPRTKLVALGILVVVTVEAWTGQFAWRANRWRNATAELCTFIWTLPLPATLYTLGTGMIPDISSRCIIRPGEVQIVPVESVEQVQLTAHSAAIIFVDREEAAQQLLPHAVLTPHYNDDRFAFYSAIGKPWATVKGWNEQRSSKRPWWW